MPESKRRRYFKSADEFRAKTRNADLAKWDIPLGGPEPEVSKEAHPAGELLKTARPAGTDRLSGILKVLEQWEERMPSRRVASDRGKSVVYFVRVDDVVKIGIAADVDKRLGELQTANPKRLQLLGTIIGGRMKEIELHERFRHLRLSGEWFTASAELLDYISTVLSR